MIMLLMDRRTQFSHLKQMIDNYEGDEISFVNLRVLISINIASTPKIVDNAIKILGMAGMIKDIGSNKFKIIRK